MAESASLSIWTKATVWCFATQTPIVATPIDVSQDLVPTPSVGTLWVQTPENFPVGKS